MEEPSENIGIKGQSKKKKITTPRRNPSYVVSQRKPVYITADKTTCRHCGFACFPKEDPYVKNKKLHPCLKSPQTLYELASKVVDQLPPPAPFSWSIEDVANWICDEVGLPQYRECITKNRIDGLRLLILEDPSKLPELNIRDFRHILMITSNVHRIYHTEQVRFTRSLGLPPRKPLTHCTWFKSRTGPGWGVRRNWTRSDVLRWMEIIMPEPVRLDHWDLVWYRKPDYPKVKLARVGTTKSTSRTPHYDPRRDVCDECLVPRKFRLLPHLSESKQVIWTEMQKAPEQKKKEDERVAKETRSLSRLMPKKVDLTELRGMELKLARRKLPKRKFLI